MLSALPTLTALIASAVSGQSITFTATVSDLSAGGATPNNGTVTFSDKKGAIDSETLVDGVATFTTSGLAAGTITVTAFYGGTAAFAPSTTGTIVTAAGNGTAGYTGDNDPATAAELNHPWGTAVDSAGDLFIVDGNNNVVREVVEATRDIITVAGDGTAGFSGDGKSATSAELNGPNSVAVDSAGDLFISDAGNNRIREVVKATGDIITIAGNGTAGYSGDKEPAIDAEIDSPRGLAVDSAGNVFFADNPNNRIREVEATGDIITVAGDGKAGYTGNNGPATAAELNAPNFVAVDSAGDLFIGDVNNNAVREVVASTGHIITVAGNGKAGYTGDNGLATGSQVDGANGLAIDSMGDVFIADVGNHRIREIVKATGDIITVAGNGTAGYSGDNGPATAAELDAPPRIAVDSAGDLFVTAPGNNRIRELTPAVTVIISPTTTPNPPRNPIRNPPGNPIRNPPGNPIGNPIGNPSLTPSPAVQPLPPGFLRTPPKIVRVGTKMVDRAPEIVVQLDQGIVSTLARQKLWYSVKTPGANDVLGTSDDQHVGVSKVVYRAKTHTITLVMPKRPKARGNFMLTVDARGIVNLLGQHLEGDNMVPGVNLGREIDLP